MALFPSTTARGRAGLVLAAVAAGAFGFIASALRGDWPAAALIALVVALLVLVWAWGRRDGEA